MPSREELSKLLFIFQLTLAECPKVCSQADERVREKKGAKTVPYKVQLRTEHIWSVKTTQEGIGAVSKYLRCDNVKTGFLHLGTLDVWGQTAFVVGAVLHIVGCLQPAWPPHNASCTPTSGSGNNKNVSRHCQCPLWVIQWHELWSDKAFKMTNVMNSQK